MIAIMSVQRDCDFREGQGQQRPITQDVLRLLASLAGNPSLAKFVATLRQKLGESHPTEPLLYGAFLFFSLLLLLLFLLLLLLFLFLLMN
jgi:hypothetical protein